MRYSICFVLISLMMIAVPARAHSAASEQSYQNAKDAYYNLMNSARKQMYRDQWEKVIDKFLVVNKRFPQGRRSPDALYMAAKTTEGLYGISRILSDAKEAVRLYRRVAELYPESSLADDSLMLAGALLEKPLLQLSEAYLVYDRMINALPKGDMYEKGLARLSALQSFAPATPPLREHRKPQKGPDAISTETPGENPDSKGMTHLQSIRFWSNPGYTRIVLDLSGESVFSAHFLPADAKAKTPPRLYVDIESAYFTADLQEPTAVDDGLLQQIRTGKPDNHTVRVVLDLNSLGDYKIFPLPDPFRVVIDVAADKVPEIKSLETEIHSRPSSGNDEIAKVLKEQPNEQTALRVPTSQSTSTLRRIVVDAGHGGKDPGAIGANGTLEKDVTLALARKLAHKLRSELDCEVILTRNSDVYLPLEERTAIANKVGADLFVSIHANASNSRKAHGIETYYLNFSKNDKAAAVAARENGTTLQQVSDLELILFDLMANAKINESSRLAAEIQKNLVKKLSRSYSNIRDLGVRQGPFYVLLGATMPSVLVETAFISHPREEKRLTNTQYQDHAADAIAEAVKRYAVANKLIAAR